MKEADFKIEISGLKVGKHLFESKIDASFFEETNPDLLENADLEVSLVLKKSETMIEANISVEGEATLVCDRSLKLFTEPLSVEETVFFKYGDEPQELSEDVQIIHYNEERLDFSHLIYELISLSIPMKRLHPEYRDEDEDEEWVYVVEDDEPSGNGSEEEPADPRWAALKQLNFGNKTKGDGKS